MTRSFAEWLRAERERLGLTQQQVAEIARMTTGAVGMLERGQAKPRRMTEAMLRSSLASWAKEQERGEPTPPRDHQTERAD